MYGAHTTLRMVSSGEWKSFCTSPRRGAPSHFSTAPGSATARATTSRTALWLRSAACAARQSSMKRSRSMRSVYKFAQQSSGQFGQRQRPVPADDARAVDPYAVHAERPGVEARVAAGQVEHAALGTAVH